MTQTFEIFQGNPDGLVARLNVLKGLGATIAEVVPLAQKSYYLIIHEA